ncbi:hypothetical protein GE300_21475 [Rhodobacteraceae bacterium 2CG4]|uniref:Uncharacterized protein n=1 Tax=Halovulum marinum TaxID=2662447 RepID=A0A6L5Z6N6_9RHOB|nr:hypothetical protein [Halovulum marinum]MSU92117.1 hypothetical protein [Halovulum marinum]
MSLVEIAITLAAAGAGGTAAWTVWRLSEFLKRHLPRRAARAPAAATAADPAATAPRAVAGDAAGDAADDAAAPAARAPADLAPPPVPPPAADLASRLDALRADVATLAQAQLVLLEGRAERENRLLAEMRAIAATPELSNGLSRVEKALVALADRLPETAPEADQTANRGSAADADRTPPRAPGAAREVVIDDDRDADRDDGRDDDGNRRPAPRPEPARDRGDSLVSMREHARGADDSLVSMLDHARNGPRADSSAETGRLGRRGLGPAE